MASTYAALVSLMNLIDHTQFYHSCKPIFVAKQLLQFESLQEKVKFLQEFLEVYNPRGLVTKEEQDLERRIADAAYRAEEIIESHMMDYMEATATIKSHDHFSDLHKVIKYMDSIGKEVMTKIMKKSRRPEDLVPVGSMRPAVAPTTTGKDTTLVFDEELEKIMDMLIGQGSNLQIIPIAGMGGIGKTTLAKNAYNNPCIVEHFDIRGWITISQTYIVRDILLGLALGIGVGIGEGEKKKMESHQLVTKIYQHLSGRKYLITMDDMWSVDAWDELQRSFPKNDNGSRIMVTTRLSNVANYFGSSDVYQMNLLDEDKSWRLLCTKVFAREHCPLHELEEIGKKIAKNCKGLPLSIVVIGGLLAKSKMTREHWEFLAENISTAVNLEDGESCFKVLSLSYYHLPIHLKPCFLYMGVFPEHHEIRVSQLIKLWVAEGFLKPFGEKSLEEIAKDYLKDLIDRNLLIGELGSTGNLKFCKIHDLLRDLCLRVAHREMFFCVTSTTGHNNAYSLGINRRIAIHHNAEYLPQVSDGSQSIFWPRTVLSFTRGSKPSINYKFCRILRGIYDYSLPDIVLLKNSRYLHLLDHSCFEIFPPIVSLWNLQTLIVGPVLGSTAPSEIWEMPQLRHLQIKIVSLPDPSSGRTNDFVMKNLQTLSWILDFRCTEEVVERIPNINKLKIYYGEFDAGISYYCLKNLGCLNKLQSLEIWFAGPSKHLAIWSNDDFRGQNLQFSASLKKLTLDGCCFFNWEDDIATAIGVLPNLEKLTLIKFYGGEEWSPVEGQFLRLKYLKMQECDLVRWIAQDIHFPCLEHLLLYSMKMLEDIPFGFADIATLQSIKVYDCSNSVGASAKEILKEQQNIGNEEFCCFIFG